MSARADLHVEEVTESSREAFDRSLEAFACADIVQSYAWGELKRAFGWRPIRLVVKDGRGRVRAAVSVLERPLPLGSCLLYAPRGPVLNYEERDVLAVLLEELATLARRRRAVFLKIDPPILRHEADVVVALKAHGYRRARARRYWGGIQPQAVCRLDLSPHRDEVFARFHPKTRYNIRLADRRGVTVRQGSRADLPLFHAILLETAERQRFGIRSLAYFEALWDHLAPAGRLELYFAELRGEALAGAILAFFGPTASYLYGGSRNRLRDAMPAYAVQWHAIQRAKERGARVYDFLGVSMELDPSHPLHGLYRFKRGFGALYAEFLGEFDLPIHPAVYRLWNVAEPVYLRTMSHVETWRRSLAHPGRSPRPATRGELGPSEA